MSTPRPIVHHGDCLAVLRTLPDESVDAVVTDPPYGLSNTDPKHVAETLTKWVTGDHEYTPPAKGGFMGKTWDSFVPPPAVWDECMRVLKPGGHLLVFAGTRTQDLMGLSIRLAGFDIRDGIGWIYGSGFPKSMDVSKAIESKITTGKSNSRSLRETEQAGEGEAYTLTGKNNGIMGETRTYDRKEFTPATPEAEQWAGWGTALKPAIEPVIVARKPIRGTVAANVLAHGTGGINVDACRVPGQAQPFGNGTARTAGIMGESEPRGAWTPEREGRFPPNVLLDPEAAAAMDEQSGTLKSGKVLPHHADNGKASGTLGAFAGAPGRESYGDSGGASRFFPVFKYQAKAPAKERPQYTAEDGRVVKHATVKPLELMRWLVRLVTPAGGVVLDPFAGSGTTGEAAMLEGFDSILIEGEAEHLPLIDVRIDRSADDTTPPAPEPEPTPPTLHDRITACTSRAELADLYDEVTATDPAAWTDEHTAAGTAHLATIERTTT